MDGYDVDMHFVSFVLTATYLITMRYHESRAFRTFPSTPKFTMGCEVEGVLIAFVEAVVAAYNASSFEQTPLVEAVHRSP